MPKTTSLRMETLPPLFFASLEGKIAALKKEGADVIRLDVGSPDLPPAEEIIATLARSAAQPDRHGYTPQSKPHELRQAWAEMYRQRHGVELDPQSEILPLMGSKEGIFNLMMALIDPGEVVLIPDPGYPTYRRGARCAGGEPHPLPLLPERDFLPDLGSVPTGLLSRARILWLNYPNNPTAATAPLPFFEAAIAFARQNDLLVCHDAAYTQVTFEGYHAPSLLEIPGAREVAVEFNTLSKSHNMAGWRVGAAVGNAAALQQLAAFKTNVDSGHFLPVLEAAIAAMQGDQSWLAERNEIYRQRRDIVVQALHQLGLPAKRPHASLYVWCPLPEGWTSFDYAKAVLDEAHVSLTPGIVFGENGDGYVRIALTASLEKTEEAMQRLTDWMRR